VVKTPAPIKAATPITRLRFDKTIGDYTQFP
jgi:hypothetical protein